MTASASVRSQRAWVLALTSIASFMVALDSLVVISALPAIHRELGGGLSMLDWTINAYGADMDSRQVVRAAAG